MQCIIKILMNVTSEMNKVGTKKTFLLILPILCTNSWSCLHFVVDLVAIVYIKHFGTSFVHFCET